MATSILYGDGAGKNVNFRMTTPSPRRIWLLPVSYSRGNLHSSRALIKPEDSNLPNFDSNARSVRADSSLPNQSASAKAEWNDSRTAQAAIFPDGKILESRFRILHLLGRGGMGEVYEAEDLVLKQNVALKTLLPQIASDERSRRDFLHEVRLAREVTHPNVCRIYDVFGDTLSSGGGSAIEAGPLFMTMELLHGQTLSQFLEEPSEDISPAQSTSEGNKRRLTAEEALPLVSQMVGALDAAHKQGIVHRDFKSSNVFLATRPGVEQSRLVVTDFGLARPADSGGPAINSFTGRNAFVGTPLYMAPEQVEGGESTPATDVYALGVVLYEMVTGTWPFVGKNALETANLRLKSRPAAPKKLAPSLDDRWNEVILRCLEREQADRFQSAAEVLEALTGESARLRLRTRGQRERLRKLLQVGAALIVLVAAVAAAYRFWPGHPPSEAKSIAVVRFQNVSRITEKNWIGPSLEESLTRDLAASDGLRVTPPADVARARQELDIPSAGAIDEAAVSRITNDLGVDRLVLGDYETSGQASDAQIRVSLRVLDPSGGSEPLTITETGRETDIFGLSDHIAHDLRVDLKVAEISSASRAQLLAAVPNNLASPAYFNGLQKLGEFDPLSARDFLEDAVKDNPDSPLPHLALSQAWEILGYDQKALDEAKFGQQTSKKLSMPEQRAIECRVLELERSNWDTAIDTCRGVWVTRKRLDDGLRLAAVQFSAERSKDAVETLAALRHELLPPDNVDPRIDIQEALNREAMTQYAEMESAAGAAAAKAEKKGARLLQGQALLWACIAKQSLDKLQDARKDCTLGNDLFATIGDKISQARTLTNIAHILSKLGDASGAAAKYAEALELAKNVGSMRDRCDALLNYGDALYEGGKLDDAIGKYKESLQIAEESGNRGCQAHATENLGSIAMDRREFALAKKNFDQSQMLYSDLNMSADLARLQSNLGDLLWEQGDPAAARTLLEDAAKRRRELGLRDGLGLTLVTLGNVLLAQDDLNTAYNSYNEAVDIKRQLHEDDDATGTQIYVAQALVELGKAADAEPLAGKLAPWCAGKHDPDNEVFARDVLVRSLLAQPTKKDAAETETKALQALLPKATDEGILLSARITIAQALATQGAFPRAVADLRAIVSEAHQRSFVMQELSANLALAEIEKMQGARMDSSSVQALAKTAKSKGYLLLARKASALLAAH
jgi:eukaryotic-like serine/threonine-protein kinase